MRICANSWSDRFAVIYRARAERIEEIIAAVHRDWGEAQGNYDEFRFFTGLSPSEQIALQVTDSDLVKGAILVTKARVMRRDKDRTKTAEDRVVELCPRALEVLKRQLALRERYVREGRIDHDDLFFKENGEPIRNLNDPYDHWVWTLMKSVTVRCREPYAARHSCVSWNLMIGKNLLCVSKQHGHSVQTMLSTCAPWTEGAKDEDIELIRAAMGSRPVATAKEADVRENRPLASPEFGHRFVTAAPPELRNPLYARRNVWWKGGLETRPRFVEFVSYGIVVRWRSPECLKNPRFWHWIGTGFRCGEDVTIAMRFNPCKR